MSSPQKNTFGWGDFLSVSLDARPKALKRLGDGAVAGPTTTTLKQPEDQMEPLLGPCPEISCRFQCRAGGSKG